MCLKLQILVLPSKSDLLTWSTQQMIETLVGIVDLKTRQLKYVSHIIVMINYHSLNFHIIQLENTKE